jgi:glutaredoxin
VAAVVLGAATILGVWWRRRQGRFTAVGTAVGTASATADGAGTLLLFTTPTCTSCHRVRELCATVGVGYEEVDASVDVDRARAFDVWRAPTLFVIDGAGVPVWRATGVPDRDELVAAVAGAIR